MVSEKYYVYDIFNNQRNGYCQWRSNVMIMPMKAVKAKIPIQYGVWLNIGGAIIVIYCNDGEEND